MQQMYSLSQSKDWTCSLELFNSFTDFFLYWYHATLCCFDKDCETKRSKILHKNDVSNKLMGPIHTLCLHLVATEIIQLQIMKDKKHLIGKLELSPKFVVVNLGIVDGQPLVLVDSYWEGIQLFEVN